MTDSAAKDSSLDRWTRAIARIGPNDLPTYGDLAVLIVPKDTPKWLPALFEWSGQGLRADINFEKKRLGRRGVKIRLEKFGAAADLLARELQFYSPIKEFLELDSQGLIKNLHKLIKRLEDLSYRAEFAVSSPILSQEDGKTSAGRNRALPPRTLTARIRCAALIAETRVFFERHGNGSRNKEAALAAEIYWRASGGKPSNQLNEPTVWRRHFEAVARDAENESITRLRRSWRKHLTRASEQGRPPFFLGTYFPYRDGPI
jgi:hypothetical protein